MHTCPHACSSISLVQIVPSPTEPYANTRNVLTAWAVRNPAVRIRALRSLPSPLPAEGTSADAARTAALSSLRRSGGAAVRALPPSVGLVLMLDLESANTFVPSALLSALGWGRQWDAVCAPTRGSDG